MILNWLKERQLQKKNCHAVIPTKKGYTFFVTKKESLNKLSFKDRLPRRLLFWRCNVEEVPRAKTQVLIRRQIHATGHPGVGTAGGVVDRKEYGVFTFIQDELFEKILGWKTEHPELTNIGLKQYVITNHHVVSLTSNEQQVHVHHPTTATGRYIAFKAEHFLPEYDCALLSPISKIGHDWIQDHYDPKPFKQMKEGDELFKEGRTTGKTEGVCVSTNATIAVDYPTGTRICRGVDVYRHKQHNRSFTKSGDSGSLILSKDKTKIHALHFAGNNIFSFGYPLPAFAKQLQLR